MQKQEFEEMIESTVTDEQYKVIEGVYMWHPSAFNKGEVAELFNKFGMTMFHDMHPRAMKAKELDEKLKAAQSVVAEIEKEIEELSCGNAPERVQVLPEAFEEHLKMSERQRQRDRDAIALAQKSPGICQQ